MIPTKCYMDDLSDLIALTPTLVLELTFIGDKGISKSTMAFRSLFIRLLDKTIEEYSLARALIIKQIEEGNRTDDEMKEGRYIYMFRFIDKIENCLQTIRRIFRILEKLNSNIDKLSITKKNKKIIRSHSRRIIMFRDAIEHIDDKIRKENFLESSKIFLDIIPDQTGIEYGNINLLFSDISSIIRSLYLIGEEILKWDNSGSEPV